MYIEGNSITHGDSARLLSSMCHYNGPLCLKFWYHMYGSATAMALNIYLLKDNKATKLMSIKNNHGPEWRPVYVDISVSGPFQVSVTLKTDNNVPNDVCWTFHNDFIPYSEALYFLLQLSDYSGGNTRV